MLNARTELKRHIWALVAVGYLQSRAAGHILIQQTIVLVVLQDTLMPGHPYKIQRSDSSYKKHIYDICDELNCSKAAAIRHLIKNKLKMNEKSVFYRTLGPRRCV